MGTQALGGRVEKRRQEGRTLGAEEAGTGPGPSDTGLRPWALCRGTAHLDPQHTYRLRLLDRDGFWSDLNPFWRGREVTQASVLFLFFFFLKPLFLFKSPHPCV